ncbi:uncharacterized protein LOC143459628 [Clavelina lepadiformis]|uniref:uncharacterized protein LOC143459628 n=1 Tax=Clavelina lepadiformis TaxID=159417 RepID=UPI004041850D
MSSALAMTSSERKCSRLRLPSVPSCDDVTIAVGCSGSLLMESPETDFLSRTRSKEDERRSDGDDNNNNNRSASAYLSKLLDSKDFSNDLDVSPSVFNDSDPNNFSYVSMKSMTPVNGRTLLPSKSASKKNSRQSHRHKPAEVFRKDLISAMKIPDTSQLLQEEYWLMQDPWRIEWEKGVQVPVNPKSIPSKNVRLVPKETHGDFRLPRKMVKSSPDPSDKDMINLNILADTTCRYDLDEMDVCWLKEINKERKFMGMQPLDEFSMEQIMEELETQCHENMQIAIQTKEGLGIEYDEDVVCDVCRLPDCEEGNEMVFCDGCNLCVHQACYGILKVPEGSWLCRPCSLGIRGSAVCILCDRKGGAMKSTRSGNKWAHVSCALWIPEISIADPERMEPITKVSHVPASRWSLLCNLCKERVGACIQCSVKHCVTAYHVTCAIEAKLDMIADCPDKESDFADDAVIFRSYCKKHSKNRKDSDDEEERSDEERRSQRHHRIMELEEEFYTLVKASAVEDTLSVPIETAQQVMDYWKLKRKSNFNRPLITPKHEEDTALAEAAETNLQRRLRMFTHLRQDLERVRNLCYMIGRREKTKRATVKNMESVFLTQMKLLERRMCHDEHYDTRRMVVTLQKSSKPQVCELARKESLLLAKTPEWTQSSERSNMETNEREVEAVEQVKDEAEDKDAGNIENDEPEKVPVVPSKNGLHRKAFLSATRKREALLQKKCTLKPTEVSKDVSSRTPLRSQRKRSLQTNSESDAESENREPESTAGTTRKMRRAKAQAWTAWRSQGASASPSAFTVKTDKTVDAGFNEPPARVKKSDSSESSRTRSTQVLTRSERNKSEVKDAEKRRSSVNNESIQSNNGHLIVKWDSDKNDNPDIMQRSPKVSLERTALPERRLRSSRSKSSNSQNDEKLSDKEVKLSSLKSRNEDSTRTPSMTTGPATRSHCSSTSTGSNETSTRPPKRLAASNAKNESGALARSCDSSGESGEKGMSHGQGLRRKRTFPRQEESSSKKENLKRNKRSKAVTSPDPDSGVMLSISNIQKDEDDGGYRGDMDESDSDTSCPSRHKIKHPASSGDGRLLKRVSGSEDSAPVGRRQQKISPLKRKRSRTRYNRPRESTNVLFKGFMDVESNDMKKSPSAPPSSTNLPSPKEPKNEHAAGDLPEVNTEHNPASSVVGGLDLKVSDPSLIPPYHLPYKPPYMNAMHYQAALLQTTGLCPQAHMTGMPCLPPNVYYPVPPYAMWPPHAGAGQAPYPLMMHQNIPSGSQDNNSPTLVLPDSTLSPESQQKPAIVNQTSEQLADDSTVVSLASGLQPQDGSSSVLCKVDAPASSCIEPETKLPIKSEVNHSDSNKKKKHKKSKKKKKKKRKRQSSIESRQDSYSEVDRLSSGSGYDEYCVEYCSTLPTNPPEDEENLSVDESRNNSSEHPTNSSFEEVTPAEPHNKLLLKIDKKMLTLSEVKESSDRSSEENQRDTDPNEDEKGIIMPLKLKLCGQKSDRTLRGGLVAREYQILEPNASSVSNDMEDGNKTEEDVDNKVCIRGQAALCRLGRTTAPATVKSGRTRHLETLETGQNSSNISMGESGSQPQLPPVDESCCSKKVPSEPRKRGRPRKVPRSASKSNTSSNTSTSVSLPTSSAVGNLSVDASQDKIRPAPPFSPSSLQPERHWKKRKVREHETSVTTETTPDDVGMASNLFPEILRRISSPPGETSGINSSSSALQKPQEPTPSTAKSSSPDKTLHTVENQVSNEKPKYSKSSPKRHEPSLAAEKFNSGKVSRSEAADGLPPVSPYKFTVSSKFQKKTSVPSGSESSEKLSALNRLITNKNQPKRTTAESKKPGQSVNDPYEFADFGS